MDMMNLIEIGQNIKLVSEKYLPGISLNRAAGMALLSYTQLKKIESGIYNARILTIIQIAERWNVPIEEFFAMKKEEVRKTDSKRIPAG